MLKAVLAVVAGYATSFVAVFVTFSAAYLALGANGAFREGTYEVTTVWIVAMFGLGFLSAIAGGVVTLLIADGRGAIHGLAVVILVLGLASAAGVAMAEETDPPPVRTADVGNMEAMMQAKTPLWVALLNPVVGIAGVYTACALMGRRTKAGSATT